MDLQILSDLAFFNMFNRVEFNSLRFPKIIGVRKCLGISLEIFGVIWCPQNQILLVLGVMVTSARSEQNEHEGFSGFPEINHESH